MKQRNKKFDYLFEDSRTKKVMGFLISKKLLMGTNIPSQPNVKIPIIDAIWVANHVEPRVMEVLPAALIHFPKTFIGWHNLPNRLIQIIKDLKKNKDSDIIFNGIKYRDMKRWANKVLPDKRTKPLSELKINKTYRFKRYIYEKMKEQAERENISITRYIEILIEQDILKKTGTE